MHIKKTFYADEAKGTICFILYYKISTLQQITQNIYFKLNCNMLPDAHPVSTGGELNITVDSHFN